MEVDKTFVVKYLGYRTTTHLWGIKYTRTPVDDMVKQAKSQLVAEKVPLPLLKMQITDTGIQVSPMPQNQNPSCPTGKFPIEAISYGVQDIVYTRVMAMIVVNQDQKIKNDSSAPFRCHAFVCDSRETARRLTVELSKAFSVYSKRVKGEEAGSSGKSGGGKGESDMTTLRKKFTIDLRPPEEIRKDGEGDGIEEDGEDFSEA